MSDELRDAEKGPRRARRFAEEAQGGSLNVGRERFWLGVAKRNYESHT
jgi:hypothetical protein